MTKLAILVGKVIQKLLRMMHRGGGSTPGLLALKLDPQLLKHLALPETIVIVTGTNGKSTVTNLLTRVLQADGRNVLSNLEGNNLKIGIASLLLDHASFSGKVQADALVLEVDELSVPRVMEDITPTHLVIGNLFRDQLDRVGEMETVIRKVSANLLSYTGTLLLNGDDPNVARFALEAPHAKVAYFGVAKQSQSTAASKEASEGRFCPLCKKELVYSYYQYSHIGRFACVDDGFGTYAIPYLAEVDVIAADRPVVFTVAGDSYESAYHSLFALYNETEVIAMASLLGVAADVIRTTILNFRMNNGRMEQFTLKNGQICTLNLAKNPTGINETLKYMTSSKQDFAFAMVLNDLDADGQDVSWIYDARFELLDTVHTKFLFASGTRALDMALRLQYASLTAPIAPFDDLDELILALTQCQLPVYVIANYTALQKVRRSLQRGSI